MIGYTSENEVQMNCSSVSKIYFLYEYSELKLKDYLQPDRKMALDEAWLLLYSVVEIMTKLQHEGIFYGDINTNNILMFDKPNNLSNYQFKFLDLQLISFPCLY